MFVFAPIRTARLILRPIEPGDQLTFEHAYARSLEFWAPWFPLRAADDTPTGFFRKQLQRAAENHASSSAARLLAFTHGGTLVGSFNLNNIVRGIFQNADAGWSLFEGCTGHGYAEESLRALLTLAFLPATASGTTIDGVRTGLGLHRVQAGIMPHNAASLKLAAKVGLRAEGLAKRYLHIAGEWSDHVLHALTSEEWDPALQRSRPISG